MLSAAREIARLHRDSGTSRSPMQGESQLPAAIASAPPPRMPGLLVGVTGHRKLRPEDINGLRDRVRTFLVDLQQRYPLLPVVVVSPLAEGADGLVADVAFDLGLRVVAPLPLPVEAYRRDFDTPGALVHFERRLLHSEILELPVHRDALGDPDVPGPARDRQYAQAGFFVSRHCHVLLALWDGQEQDSLGGTSHVVRFHLHGDMPGQLQASTAALALLGMEEGALVHHLPAARLGEAAPAAGDGRWLSTLDEPAGNAAIPEAFDRMFRHQAEFDEDLQTYRDAIAADTADTPDTTQCPVHRLFVAADWMARNYQRRVVRVLRATYVLAAATGAAFIVYAHVHSQNAIIYLYLLLFAAGVGLAVLVRRREWHRKYLDYRALAEGLRVQSFLRRAGVIDIASPSHTNESFIQEQDLELGWIRNVMRTANIDGLLAPLDVGPAQLDAVIAEWVGTPESDGQLHYFSATADKRAGQHRHAERLARASLAIGISISVVLALFAHRWGYTTKNVLVVVMGLLSVGAGVHEAYAHKKADKELVKQYRFMQRIYAGARRKLDAATTDAQKREILRVLGEAALAEHVEWTLVHRERPLEHTRLGG